VFGQQLAENDLWLMSHVSEAEVYKPLGTYLYVMWAVFLLSFLILLVFSLSTRRFLQKPMRELVQAFHRVEEGRLDVALPLNTNDEFKYLYARFNAMLEYLRNLIDQVYRQRLLSQKAELKQLQSQINPHFLYNSFFMLQRLVQSEDQQGAASLCAYLGNYFRYVTRNAQEELPLSQEVEHARNYMEIQQMRFSRMEIRFDPLPPAYADLLVPRLVLQPVMENAFAHGLTQQAAQQRMHVGFETDGNELRVIVEDNGKGAASEPLEAMNRRLQSLEGDEVEMTGILNVNRRIRLRFSGNSGVRVSRSDLGGWKVCLCFDVKGAADVSTVDRG
jgi:two-component system sensor histidine kinase YesM